MPLLNRCGGASGDCTIVSGTVSYKSAQTLSIPIDANKKDSLVAVCLQSNGDDGNTLSTTYDPWYVASLWINITDGESYSTIIRYVSGQMMISNDVYSKIASEEIITISTNSIDIELSSARSFLWGNYLYHLIYKE